jgi:DNA uptake protein ComE-like DNA-binding protein
MKRRAAALMVVLWVLAVLVVVCLAIGSSARFRQTSLRRARSHLRDSQALLSAVAFSKAILLADPTSEDTLQDTWTVADGDGFAFEVSERQVALYAEESGLARAGLADESSRVNINTAQVETLAALPGMTWAAAERLIEIREDAIAADPSREDCAFATEAELLAVLEEALEAGGFIYGTMGSAAEFSPLGASISGAALDAARNMTVYSRQRNVDAAGRPRVNLNEASANQLMASFGEHLTERQIEAIVLSRQETRFESIGELLTRELSVPDEHGEPIAIEISVSAFRDIADRLTTSDRTVLVGLVNVNTAPAQVLQALPVLDASDAGAIVEARTRGEDQSNLAWLLDVLTPQTFAACCNRLTTRSQQFRMYAGIESSGRPPRRAMAILERDGGRCAVLAWTTWRESSDEPVR